MSQNLSICMAEALFLAYPKKTLKTHAGARLGQCRKCRSANLGALGDGSTVT
jgi:hypothetical protein